MRPNKYLLVPSVSFECQEGSPTQAHGSVFGIALVLTHPLLQVAKIRSSNNFTSAFRIGGLLLIASGDLLESAIPALGAELLVLVLGDDETNECDDVRDEGQELDHFLAFAVKMPAAIST